MGTAYTRQSTLTDGDTITAALFNNEYNQLLTAFSYASSGTTGHQHDGTAGEGGNIAQIGDQDFLNKIVVDSSNNRWGFYVEVSSSAVEQIRVQDGAIVPVTDNDIDLGTSSLQFKDAFINGTLEADAITIAGVTLAETISDTVGAMVGSNTETGITVTYDDSDNTLDFVIGTLNQDTTGNAGTFTVTANNSTDETVFPVFVDGATGSQGAETDTGLSYNPSTGTLVSSTFEPSGDTASGDNAAIGYTAAEGLILTGQGSTNDVTVKNDADTAVIQIPTGTTNVSIAGDLTVTGDLTVSGDDITMGTNTSGNLLIADGTNFNSVAVSSLSEISTVANDDVFLAIDTSGGGLKKIARSAVVSGLATSGAISNVVEDTSPQLGGNLDTNSQNILIDDAHFIGDENGNEQIIFQTTSSAVNQFDITNAATGNPPKLSATGGDSNIDLDIEAKGTGHVTIRGNTNAGAIQFNCESNSHGQILKSQPHSAAVTNELLLPAGADSTLVSLVSTDTLTNKTINASNNTLSNIPMSATSFVAGTGVSLSTNTLSVDAAQTGITSLLATDIKIGEDDQTKIDFETADEIHFYAANVEQVYLGDNIFGPQSDSDVDLGSTSVRWKDAFVDSITVTGEIDGDSLDIEGDADINGTTNLDAVDIDGAVQIDATVTVGVDDTGYDVKFFGATSGSYMLWDESVDDLILAGASRLVVPDGQLVLNSTAVTSTAAELNLLDGASTLKQIGKETIYVPAASMYPNTTAGCADLEQVELSNGPELKCLDFDASSDENAQFTVAFPKSWNEGTVTFQAFFTVTGTNTGTVAWGLSGGSMADNASINTAFGTNVVATAKAHSGTSNDINVTAESGAVTIANAAVDTLTFFQIMRDVSADDQSGDARLLGIKLFFTTDAANDA